MSRLQVCGGVPVRYTCTTTPCHGVASPTPRKKRLLARSTGHLHGTSDERFYLRARIILAGILVLVLAYELLWTNDRVSWPLFWFMWSVLVLGTVYLWLGVRRNDDMPRRMAVLAVPDLIVVGGLSFAFHDMQDLFYPVAILFPVAYALVMSNRTTWLLGVLTMGAYAVGHLMAQPAGGDEIVILSLKLAAIPLIAAMVASSVGKQRAREEETRRLVAEKASLNTVLEQRLSELQAVSQITEIIHSSLDFDAVGPVVLEIIGKVLGMETCCLFVIDKERSETLFSASYGRVGRLPAYPGLPEGLDDDHFACMTAFDHQDTMVLFCANSEAIERLTKEDRLVLGAVASELVVAVENSRLYRLTKKLAVTDELTGLANYRQLQQKLDDEIDRATRYGKRVSLIMIDVDDFKGFNDTHGHIAGDQALAELGNVMVGVVREVDLVARYGGEEFSIVLPETDAPGAFVAAEKVREAVSGHLFADENGARRVTLTVSLGVATFPAHAHDKESLLREADDALYRAKHGGKNRVRTPLRVESDAGGTAPIDETTTETGE